ncbi:hypothetical protein ABZ027_31445 [Streptomyces sp. NPDC006332]|uniref:hypothetical protein n=1 Tax=Streptomyces sp. NPDC006332 TaxID=3155456 RepID=UPI0033A7B67D
MRTALRTVVAAVAMGATAATLAAAPASAAGHKVYTSYNTTTTAKATFHSYGDWYQLKDLVPEGIGVALQYKKKGDEVETMHWSGQDWPAARYEDYREGQVVYFRACSQKGQYGKVRYCDDWIKGTA